MVSFGRTYSVVKRSSENSTSNKRTSCLRSCEGEVSSSEILEIRRDEEFKNKEDLTSRRIIEKSSSKKEDEVFLKVSYGEDDYEATKPSNK